MLIPGRKYSSATQYRYGFNGKENDNEVKRECNEQDYGMRIYDPRLGRFLSVDPLTRSYPFYTPYSFAGNKSIAFIDLDGLEEAQPKGSIIMGGWGAQLTVRSASDKDIKEYQRGMGTAGVIGGAILVDVFVTKGWITRTLLASQVLGAFEHNRAKTPEGRAKQDQRSREALADAFITWGAGKILGISFDVSVSALKGVAENRFNFAKSFYKAAGYSEEKTLAHTKGIDLSEKVFETTLKKGTELEQWTYLDKNGKPILGDYYSLPGTDPAKLGIPLEGRVKTTVILSEDTKFLQSTAGKLENWLKPGSGEMLEGGGTQFFQTNVKVEIKK